MLNPVYDFIIYGVKDVGVQYLIAFFSVAIISKPAGPFEPACYY